MCEEQTLDMKIRIHSIEFTQNHGSWNHRNWGRREWGSTGSAEGSWRRMSVIKGSCRQVCGTLKAAYRLKQPGITEIGAQFSSQLVLLFFCCSAVPRYRHLKSLRQHRAGYEFPAGVFVLQPSSSGSRLLLRPRQDLQGPQPTGILRKSQEQQI